MEVPPFVAHYSNESMMDARQKAFYKHWLANWNQGNALAVDGNISYLFAYTYGVLRLDPEAGARELDRLFASYSGEKEPFPWYCRKWTADFYLLRGDLRTALDRSPPLKLGAAATHSANEIFNIKRELNDRIGAKELLGLIGPKLTRWAKQHIEEVVSYLDIILEAHQKSIGRSLIVDWSVGENRYGWYLFNGSGSGHRIEKPYYCYYTNNEIVRFALGQLRDAENTVRESKGVPRVGEGWVAETTLYYQVKEAFPKLKVVHHARPEWLKPQHLDIYLPDFEIALEYQGAQHDKPVEYFGGLKQFKETQNRDARKLALCLGNNIILIYVRERYQIGTIIDEIRAIIALMTRG